VAIRQALDRLAEDATSGSPEPGAANPPGVRHEAGLIAGCREGGKDAGPVTGLGGCSRAGECRNPCKQLPRQILLALLAFQG
jgi:hypothetical protein